jgi:hypothetical protein
MADRDDDLHDSVSAMADRIGLKGRDRTQYIHEHMTRGGYRAVPQYVKDEGDDDDEGGSGFFGGRSRSRGGRDRDDDRRSGSRRKRDDDDDWYNN